MLMLDTQTFDGAFRMTAFTDTVENSLVEFFHWMDENSSKPEDVWYADIFELDPEGAEDPKRILTLKPLGENKAEVLPKADGASPWAFRLRPIKGFIKRIKKP